MDKVTLLAIESSCDDTGAAVLRDGRVISNVVYTQKIHEQYGGVVPEVASRAHQQKIVSTVEAALNKAEVDKREINAIAFTRGPGLIGSLIVGVNFAKGFALARNIPMIEVNHMQAHVSAHFIPDHKPEFPFLCLTVSGGHTQIVLVHDHLHMEILGQTIDDAAGEAFDKTGKILGLGYPAGPIIDKLAHEGNPVYKFPEPRVKDLDFSFSGLKTSILYFLQKEVKKDPFFIQNNLNDLCASVQKTIIDILLKKIEKASKQTGIKEIGIAGGVSANKGLRNALTEKGKNLGWNIYIPPFEYCTDNAGMIAINAYHKYLAGIFADQSVEPAARMSF